MPPQSQIVAIQYKQRKLFLAATKFYPSLWAPGGLGQVAVYPGASVLPCCHPDEPNLAEVLTAKGPRAHGIRKFSTIRL